VEAAYRFFTDTYGITAHTLGLTWNQKLGKRFTLSPFFRYYQQSAASFYVTRLAHSSKDEDLPLYYSADYRLSEMETFTFGMSAVLRVTDWMSLEASYKRYEMFGLDHITSPSAYPKAHIVTAGFRLWF
jgi:hypothetical protein